MKSSSDGMDGSKGMSPRKAISAGLIMKGSKFDVDSYQSVAAPKAMDMKPLPRMKV